MKIKIVKTKKAQAWGIDLMIASIMFISGIVVFYLYTLNTSDQSEEIINLLSYDGKIILDVLLSEGFPINWNEQNVINPGILTENKINQTKLEQFYALSLNEYERTKTIFNTRYEYYVFLSDNITINGEEKAGIGKPPENPKNLIKISRVTIYNNKPLALNIYVWQ